MLINIARLAPSLLGYEGLIDYKFMKTISRNFIKGYYLFDYAKSICDGITVIDYRCL